MKTLWVLALLASPLVAQQGDLASRLAQRGAAPDFARAVSELAAQARAAGLPVEPLADKAFEGLAKGYGPEQILPVVQRLVGRLREGQAAVTAAGVAHASGAVVAAAAEALGRGIDPAEVGEIIRAAPSPPAASVGLAVAASLTAQGIVAAEASRAVADAYRKGRSSEDVLELPSVTSSWFAEGVEMPEVLQRIHEGRALPFPAGRGAAQSGPPGGAPGKGPPINPPGRKPHHP